MQEHTQTDQNPVEPENLKVQEEKTETAEAVINTELKAMETQPEIAPQLSEGEVLEVRNLLQKAPLSADEIVLEEEAVTDAPPKNETENIRIPKEKGVAIPVKQLDETEINDIIQMLHGATELSDTHSENTQSDDADEDSLSLDDVDFEHINKQELVELLEEVVQEKDLAKIRGHIAKIKGAYLQRRKEDFDRDQQDFISGGGDPANFVYHEDPLDDRYNQAFRIYKEHKARFTANFENEKKENLKSKLRILDELKELIASEETLKKTYDEFKRLQDEWKDLGMVPASELNNLWQSYHFLVEMFFDKVRINKELRDLDLKKNLDIKLALCEKAEELFVEKSVIKSFKLLQKYHDEWRETGPVPSDKKEELWERFKAATDTINLRRKEHYKNLQEEQEANHVAKLLICEKAEQLLNSEASTLKEWQDQTKSFNELMKVWKSVGRAPKTHNDEVWTQFKKSLDVFYERKRVFFSEIKEQQLNNYNIKLNLCAEAEALKDSEDWKATTQNLIRLQNEWKKVGPVPRRHSDKLWKRFRASCDSFFKRKSAHFKTQHASEGENLQKKKEIINQILEFQIGKNKSENLNRLKDFQNQWMNIGFVPFQEKDKIQKQYRDAIDQLINKMEINKQELSAAGFEEKVELLKSAPDADWRLSKERQSIEIKIKRMQEDVTVWENNIGFFSSSAKSNQLKTEFERKINKAKSEIEGLKQKLKVIDNA